MRLRTTLAVLAAALLTSSARAYVEAAHSLGQVVQLSTNIVLMRVDKVDKEKRIALYRRLQEIILEEAPYTFLYMPKSITAFDRRFRGTKWYPTGGPRLSEWWVARVDQKYEM